MRFGSLFTGIGGFDLGFERAGLECAWQVEADPRCRQVLRRHWPGVPIYDDVRTVGGELGAVDLVCGGFPCQDVSVAGRREGLAGARSGLWWEFHRILAALAPRWVCIENVPGLLSSNEGRDLGAIIGSLAELGYVGTWRVLDSQHFGVAQRRRRLFVVGHLGDEPIPEVLLEPESVCGDSPPSRGEGARGAATLTRGADSAGRGGAAGRRQEDDVNVVAHTLTSGGHDASDDGSGRGTPLVVGALGAGGSGGRGYRCGADEASGGQVVVGALQAHSTSHGHAMTTQQAVEAGQVIAQCHSSHDPSMETYVTGFAVNQRREVRDTGETVGALHAPSGTQVEGVLHSPSSGRVSHADEEEAYAAAIVRVLREEIGEAAFSVWNAGGALPLHPEEVLRSEVHGGGLPEAPVAGEDELGSVASGGTRDLPARSVREVRQGEGGSSPSGCNNTLSNLQRLLSRLPHQGASGRQDVLHRWLLGSAQGSRVLRQALSEVQEVGRPAGLKAESAHPHQEGGLGVSVPRRLTPRLPRMRAPAGLSRWLDRHRDR